MSIWRRNQFCPQDTPPLVLIIFIFNSLTPENIRERNIVAIQQQRPRNQNKGKAPQRNSRLFTKGYTAKNIQTQQGHH